MHFTVLATLHQLLKKGTSWRWSKVEKGRFVAAKQSILNSRTLVHYDHALPLLLSCDASSHGAGAVLSHQIAGKFRPVAFASCSLTLVCYTAVVSVVTKRSSSRTAAENRTTFLCVCGLTNKPIMYSMYKKIDNKRASRSKEANAFFNFRQINQSSLN